MSNKIKGYVHYAKYKKDGELHEFEHIDVHYDYEKELQSLNSDFGQDNMKTFLEHVYGAEEVIEIGLKEVEVEKVRSIEAVVDENGGQNPSDFAVILNPTDGKEPIEIQDFLMRYYMNRKIKLTVELLD